MTNVQLLFSNILFPDEESSTSSEKYSSNLRLIPEFKRPHDSNYGRESSANPSSLGHESGFQSSSSIRSLTPSLIAGSMYEYPTRAMDNNGGNGKYSV